MTLPSTRVAPTPDRDSIEWWAAVRRHEVVVQRCEACGVRRWPARGCCPRCLAFDSRWEPTTGEGILMSWATTHHVSVPGFAVPYHSVFVRLHLPDGAERAPLLLPGSWQSDDVPSIGMHVRAAFEDLVGEDGLPFTLLGWAPA
jgi:uncharacterized OB-fold protein